MPNFTIHTTVSEYSGFTNANGQAFIDGRWLVPGFVEPKQYTPNYAGEVIGGVAALRDLLARGISGGIEDRLQVVRGDDTVFEPSYIKDIVGLEEPAPALVSPFPTIITSSSRPGLIGLRIGGINDPETWLTYEDAVQFSLDFIDATQQGNVRGKRLGTS